MENSLGLEILNVRVISILIVLKENNIGYSKGLSTDGEDKWNEPCSTTAWWGQGEEQGQKGRLRRRDQRGRMKIKGRWCPGRHEEIVSKGIITCDKCFCKSYKNTKMDHRH